MESPSDARFRTSAKAIIVEHDALLTIHCRDDQGDFYYLPGGGQEIGEPVTDALKRECLEEIGCRVGPGRLLFVRDYISWNHEFVDLGADSVMVARPQPSLGDNPHHEDPVFETYEAVANSVGCGLVLNGVFSMNLLKRLAEIPSVVGLKERSEERRVGKECRSRWSPSH